MARTIATKPHDIILRYLAANFQTTTHIILLLVHAVKKRKQIIIKATNLTLFTFPESLHANVLNTSHSISLRPPSFRALTHSDSAKPSYMGRSITSPIHAHFRPLRQFPASKCWVDINFTRNSNIWAYLVYSELSIKSIFSGWKGPRSLCKTFPVHLILSVMPFTFMIVSTWSLTTMAPWGRRIRYISKRMSRMSHLHKDKVIVKI